MTLHEAWKVVDDYLPFLTVAEIYDEDPEFASALNAMFPGFEYPDFSHLTVEQVMKKFYREVGKEVNPQ
jgi:hypothetical protein